MHMTRRHLAIGLPFLLLGLPRALLAHLAVVKTLPAKDTTVAHVPRVQVWFSQPPSARVSRLELKGPSGPVDLGDLEVSQEDRSIATPVPGPVAAGTHEVTWRTAGTDGHVQRGTFTFVVEPAK
jgi:methionine-rich copper-binding protein CopC